jgi:thiol-disulfide isomerase/thioredoxin
VVVVVFASIVLALRPWAPALAGEEAEASPAETVLKQVAARYAAIDSYQGEIQLTIKITAQGRTVSDSAHGQYRLARPNRFRLHLNLGEDSLLFVCDGKKYWTYLSSTNQFTAQEAPAMLDGVLENPLLREALRGAARFTVAPFSSDPYQALMADVQSAELLEATPADPPGTKHVVLHLDQVDADLWIGEESRKVERAILNPYGIIEAQKAQNPQAGDLAMVFEVLSEGSGPLKDAGPEAFAFEPPEGATQVSGLQELFQVDLTGQSMKDFALEGLTEGTTWQLSEQKGKVIALDFWATWCPPCRAELPKLQEIYREYRDQGFLLLAVNVAEDRQTTRKFLEEMKLDVPVALDPDGQVAAAYNIQSLPTLILIGKGGQIQQVHTGYAPGMEKVIKQQVAALLAGE